MAEYLSPGVYVEEFDSGIKAMEGVGTSTAGFVGMAQKGPVKGLPVLITSMADYQRRFGGYLSERKYGKKRFLPYAVEQFFNNGGSACYVMRVCERDDQGNYKAKEACCSISETEGKSFCNLTAADPGQWGNNVNAKFTLMTKNRTLVIGRTEISGQEKKNTMIYELSDTSAIQEDDIVCLQQSEKKSPFFFGLVEAIDGTKVTIGRLTEEAKKLQFPGGGSSESGGGSGESGGGSSESGGGSGEPVKEEETPNVFLYLAEWVLTIQDDTASEQYEGVSFNPGRSNCADNLLEKSQMIKVKTDKDNLTPGMIEKLLGKNEELSFTVSLKGGSDGTISPDIDASMYEGDGSTPDTRTGLTAFKTLSDVSIMAIPGIVDKTVQSALVSHCENMGNRFAILDMPLDAKEVSDLQEFRENVDTGYGAMYHPWLQCYDALAKRNVFLPPSGAMAGIYGRTDNTRGVHKAPANEIVRNCTGLSVRYNEAEQGKLNPKGINLIRALPGQGIRVWGARTCSSDGNWKYINVRRLFIFIEESIRANTNWAVFEPNDEMLWSRVEGTIRVFLTTQWRNGALAGSTADEAFFINIGKSTMTEDDILNGRLICVIGVAPVRPAEFVIFRITQKMESAQ